MSSSLLASSQSIGVKTTPFRAARPARQQQKQQHLVVAQAAKEPNNVVKSTFAAIAAASIALSGPAFATEGSIMPSRNRGEDNAARSFMDSKEKGGPAVQNRSSDPKSGNVDSFDVGGMQQADSRQPAGKMPKSGPNSTVSTKDQAASQPPTRGPGAGGKADEKMDPTAALKFANTRTKPTAFSFGPSLQMNVDSKSFGTGEVGTLRDQIQGTKSGAKEVAENPAQKAGQTAERVQRAADETLSNPAGEEQTKEAADNVASANAEIPKALGKGFSDLKKQLTQPSSLGAFDVQSLQRSAGMEV